MGVEYKFGLEKGIFKYSCDRLCSYLRVDFKNIKKVYEILKRLDVIYKQAKATRTREIVFNGFKIKFDNIYVKIENISNWLEIRTEVPVIVRILNRYIGEYTIESVKDIIVKIKSLKKGVVIKKRRT